MHTFATRTLYVPGFSLLPMAHLSSGERRASRHYSSLSSLSLSGARSSLLERPSSRALPCGRCPMDSYYLSVLMWPFWHCPVQPLPISCWGSGGNLPFSSPLDPFQRSPHPPSSTGLPDSPCYIPSWAQQSWPLHPGDPVWEYWRKVLLPIKSFLKWIPL